MCWDVASMLGLCEMLLLVSFNPLSACVAHIIETSQLICCANQLTGFYMRATLALNGLNNSCLKIVLMHCKFFFVLIPFSFSIYIFLCILPVLLLLLSFLVHVILTNKNISPNLLDTKLFY